MASRINERIGEVSVGAQTWKFALDAARGTVSVELEGRRYTLRAQSWQQKRMLARFAHLDDRFLEEQLLCSSLPAGEVPPEDGPARDALLALARWINAPGGRPGLPLDQQLLARVWLQVSRAIQSAPQAFDALDAADVEMLWRAARLDAPEKEEGEDAGNRIVVVPDAGAARFAALTSEKVEAGTSHVAGAPTKTEGQPDVAAREVVHERPVQEAAASPPAPKARSVQREPARRFRVTLGTEAQRLAAHSTTDIQALDLPRPLDEHPRAPLSASAPSASSGPVPSVLNVQSARTSPEAMRERPPPSQPRSTRAFENAVPLEPFMGGVTMQSRPNHAPPVDAESLFDELAARLEQALAEQGIEVEP